MNFSRFARLVLGFIAVTTIAGAAPAAAHDVGCRAGAECYTREHPAYAEVREVPAVIGVRREQILVQPGGWHSYRQRAVTVPYLTSRLIAPARVRFVREPAIVDTVRQEVVVRPGSSRWVRSTDVFGRPSMCRVDTPAVTREVERRVVTPSRLVPVLQPEIRRDEVRMVLVREAMNRHYYEPPVVIERERRVRIAPAHRETIYHPAVWRRTWGF